MSMRKWEIKKRKVNENRGPGQVMKNIYITIKHIDFFYE